MSNSLIDMIKLLFAPDTEKPATTFLNSINEAGNTALHWAALNGHLECVKLLVQSGADVTIINKAGHDAVFEAEINDKQEVVDWLLGAVEELENGIGQTGEGSSQDNGDEDMEGADDDSTTNKATVPGEGASSESAMEGLRKQMENMDAKKGPARDG